MIHNSIYTNHIAKMIGRNNNEQYRIRIYGNTLGTLSNMIDYLRAIEKNYISILSYQKIIKEIMYSKEDLPFVMAGFHHNDDLIKNMYYEKRRKFLEFQFLYEVSDIILLEEYPFISKICYNSPGFLEVIASWSPFEQIREYIRERHDRIKDKTYNWAIDREKKEAEIETIRLNNDMLKLEVVGKMMLQLKEMGLSDIEIRHAIQKYYGNLSLLNQHIDSERIVDIKRVDDYGNEILETEIEFPD